MVAMTPCCHTLGAQDGSLVLNKSSNDFPRARALGRGTCSSASGSMTSPLAPCLTHGSAPHSSFLQDEHDWRPYNEHVYSRLKQYHEQGYKVVIVRWLGVGSAGKAHEYDRALSQIRDRAQQMPIMLPRLSPHAPCGLLWYLQQLWQRAREPGWRSQ